MKETRKEWLEYVYCEKCYSAISEFDECLCLANNDEECCVRIWRKDEQ